MNENNEEIKPERLVNRSLNSGSSYRVIFIIVFILGSIFYYYSTRDDLKKEANKIIFENNKQSIAAKPTTTTDLDNTTPSEKTKDSYAELYEIYSIPSLPFAVFRVSDVRENLDILKKEKCDRAALYRITHKLADNTFKREAITLITGFASKCPDASGDILYAAQLAYSLGEYKEALELTKRVIHQSPHSDIAIYLQAKSFKQLGQNSEALLAYADVIQAALDKRLLRPEVFTDYALSYAAMGKYCEAASVLQTYISFDYEQRKNNTYKKEIEDYERQGSCGSGFASGNQEQLTMKNGIITAKVKINGVEGKFIVDTGASLVSITPEFSRKSHLTPFSLEKITTITANGNSEAQLTTIDNIKLGSLSANKVSGVIMSQNLGDGTDGLLGLSFLSRFHFSMNENKLTIDTTPIVPQANTPNADINTIPRDETIIKSQAAENTESLSDNFQLTLKKSTIEITTYFNKDTEYQSNMNINTQIPENEKNLNCNAPRNSFDYIQKIYAKEIMNKIIESIKDSSKSWQLNNIKNESSGCIAFVMSKNGTIKKSEISKRSDNHFIDVSALKAVNSLGHLYVPIEKILDEKNEVKLEFGYKIDVIKSNILGDDNGKNDFIHEDSSKKYRIMQ